MKGKLRFLKRVGTVTPVFRCVTAQLLAVSVGSAHRRARSAEKRKEMGKTPAKGTTRQQAFLSLNFLFLFVGV
jgi:hypothetical protein